MLANESSFGVFLYLAQTPPLPPDSIGVKFDVSSELLHAVGALGGAGGN